MDNLSDHNLKKSSENVYENKESSSITTALSGIVNNGTTVELDEVDLRNGFNEFHQIEVNI